MNKILKASAGTGKTYRLSLEYVASLLQGKNFAEIAVMTFTRKATAEIRERVIEHLEDIINRGRESEVFINLKEIYKELEFDRNLLQQAYEDMLKNKDSVNIFTIDSFTNRIFSQTIAPYLGVYGYEIIEDDNNSDILEKVFKEILDNPEDFEIMEKFLTDNTERDIEQYLKLIKKILKNRWKFLLIDHQSRGRQETGNLVNLLDESIEILRKIAHEKGKDFNDSFYIKKFKTLLVDYCKHDNKEARKEIIIKNNRLFFKETFWNGNQIRGKDFAEIKEELTTTYQLFRQQLAAAIFNREMIPYEEEIFNFSSRIFAIYDELKFRDKTFTHTDISNYTYKYLRLEELSSAASDYFSDISCFFIDEFQDTSILQWKILKPLLEKTENVIIVGDEKQSVYGWRGGEKELFSNIDRMIKGETESLLTCYRSESDVMEFVNRFFLNLQIDWEYKKASNLESKDEGYVEVLIGGNGCVTKTDTKVFSKKSEDIQQKTINLYDRVTRNLQDKIATRIAEIPTLNDVCILARTNKELSSIAEELDKQGIPYILEGKDNLVEHQAIKPLYFLLHYLCYRDYFNLLKFLRSQIVGVNNRTLKYLLRNKKRTEKYIEGVEITLEESGVQNILSSVMELKDLEYSELSSQLINKSGVISQYKDNNGALKNIYYFFELMRRFNSLPEFLEYIEENKDRSELKQAGIKEEEAVKLITIHKAKGLSFETVFFYWNPGYRQGYRGVTMDLYVKFDDDYRQIEDYLLTKSSYQILFEHLGYDFAEDRDRKELMEEINNVYVALTRAEKNLILYIEGPCKLELDGYSWQNGSYNFYEEAVLQGADVQTLAELVDGIKLGNFTVKSEEIQIEEISLPDLSSYFKLDEIPEGKIREINNKKDFNMNLSKEISRIEGLAIHYFMEYITYGRQDELDYAREMVLARYGNILGPVRTGQIIRRVEKFIEDNPHYFADYWQVFNEYELDAEDKTYRIDRLLLSDEKGEIVILDFKSGITREESQLEKYRELIVSRTGGRYKIKTEFLEI